MNMTITHDVISVRGKSVRVPSLQVGGRVVAVTGRFPRVASIKDEDWYEGGRVDDVGALRRAIAEAGLGADVLALGGDLDAVREIPGAVHEADNVAVIDTSDFDGWWNALPQEARKNTRRAAKRGVRVEVVEFGDDLVRGIKAIYDEAPIRQGRRFWHYGKDIETVRRENGTYLEASVFLGAYVGDELIGFMKWVRIGKLARIMQILCLNAHQDKRPIIALIAKAAEVCHQQGSQYLIYAKYSYGNKDDSSITEFKRRLGFTQLDFTRYLVPLNLRGRIALRLGLHHGLAGMLPGWVLHRLLQWRAAWLKRRSSGGAESEREEGVSAERAPSTAP